MTKTRKSKEKVVASSRPSAGKAVKAKPKASAAPKADAKALSTKSAVKPAAVKPADLKTATMKPVTPRSTSSSTPGKSSHPMSTRKPEPGQPGTTVPGSRPGLPVRPGAARSVRDLRAAREAREAREEKLLPPRLKKSPYTKRELNPMRSALLVLRSRLQGAIDKLGNEALRADEPDTDSEDVADHGSDAFERNMTLGLMENEARTLQQIEEALEQMETGRYGVCVLCGQAVPLARLEALPFATTCVPCQEKAERRL